MFSRIDIGLIIVAHLKTLRSLNKPNNPLYWPDVFTYLLLPALLAVSFWVLELNLNQQVSNLIAIISIFGGFLFNLLAIIYSYLDKFRSDKKDPIKIKFANEINANISYCILLSLFSVVLLLVYSFTPKFICSVSLEYFSRSIEFLIYLLFNMFFLTLLMVLTRVFILLQK